MKTKENDITTVSLFKEFCIELKSSFGFINETELSIIFINYYTKNVYHESTIFLYSSVNNKPVYCFLYMNIYILFEMLDWKALDVFSDMYTYDIFAPPFWQGVSVFFLTMLVKIKLHKLLSYKYNILFRTLIRDNHTLWNMCQ